MSVTERIIFLAIGGAVGFIFGYMVRALSCIQRDTAELKEAIKPKNDDGLARIPWLLDTCLFIVVALTVYASFQSQRASNNSDDAVDQVQKSNIVACQNANESRSANKQLWDFVFKVSTANQTVKPTKKQARFTQEMLDWIHKIYQLHDCSNLDRKYPIPPPPEVIKFAKHK